MNPVTGLAIGRIAIGVGALASPGSAMKMFRLDTAGNAQLPYMTRMFGSRELALGALTLATSGTTWRNVVLAGSRSTLPTPPRVTSLDETASSAARPAPC